MTKVKIFRDTCENPPDEGWRWVATDREDDDVDGLGGFFLLVDLPADATNEAIVKAVEGILREEAGRLPDEVEYRIDREET